MPAKTRIVGPLAATVAALVNAPAASAGPIPQAFAAAVPARRAVAFPVLVPTTFADMADLRHDELYVPVVAGPHHYHLEIDFAPDCGGANVCSAEAFSAFDAIYRRTNPTDAEPATARKPHAEDRRPIRNGMLVFDLPTPLAHGLTGHYTEARSAVDDGGNSSLRWKDHGIEYSLDTRLGDRATLTRIANSSIRNGPLFSGAHPPASSAGRCPSRGSRFGRSGSSTLNETQALRKDQR